MNRRFIRALLRQSVDRTPVWMMRQAGRYLPEYRALRAQTTDFMKFCQTPELAMQATLQPLARFDLDAAIIFSDILTVPNAMGCPVRFAAGEGPVFDSPVRNMHDINSLKQVDVVKDLSYVMSAIKQTRAELSADIPLIGFSGSPWTLAAYMIEGSGSKLWLHPRTMVYQNPKALLELLQRLTDVVIDYVNAQIESGADAIMIFDSWGGILSYDSYREFSLAFMQQIADKIHRNHDGSRIPLVFYTKQAMPWLSLLADSGCDAVGLDWTIDMAKAHTLIGNKVALQGNLDPAVLLSNKEAIQREVNKLLTAMSGRDGYVMNLGHGIDKSTPIANVDAMLSAIHNFVLPEEV